MSAGNTASRFGVFVRSMVAVTAMGCLFGCTHNRMIRRINHAEQQIKAEQKALKALAGRPANRLDWDKACELLELNSRLSAARSQLNDIERDRRNFVFNQLDPRISAIVNLTSALGDLSELEDKDYGIQLFANISVPNPTTIYAKRYSLELQYYMHALATHELERRLKANLYGLFLRSDEKNMHTAAALESLSLDHSMKGLLFSELEQEQQLAGEKNQRRYLQSSLNRLLNTPGQNWKPDLSSLPQISYEGKLNRLDPERGYGRLALKQAAGQVEVSLANLWRVKLNQLPNVATGLSLPVLYNSRADNQEFDTEDIRLFGSANDAFDLRGADARLARSAKVRAELLQDNIRLRLERELQELDRAKSQYELLLKERRQLERLLGWYDSNPPSAKNSKLLLGRIRELVSLRNQVHQTQMKLRRLDLEFWIWDEKYWKSPF